MREFLDALYSYAVVLFSLIVANHEVIVAVGGLFLLMVRLVVDVPRAYKTIRNKWE